MLSVVIYVKKFISRQILLVCICRILVPPTNPSQKIKQEQKARLYSTCFISEVDRHD